MPEHVEVYEKRLRMAWWVLFAIILGLVAFIRIRLLQLPLERDEGEYAYAGQLMLQGIPPYQLSYNMKFPGTYAAYALIMSIFGQTATGIHLGLFVVNAATIALVFLLGRRLFNSTAGIAAAASYAILSVSYSVLGIAGHATHFVVLPMLVGALLLLRPSSSMPNRIVFAAGILFGIGLLMKQPAVFFIPFGASYLFYRDWRAHLPLAQRFWRLAIFVCAVALPFGATCLLLWGSGVFGKFWFWTVTYARAYGSLVSLSEAPQIFFDEIKDVVDSSWPLWVLAALGMVACVWDKDLRPPAIFLFGFLGFSALALSSGLYFRNHYFILVLPAICLFVGAAVASAADYCSQFPRVVRLLPLAVFIAAATLPLLAQKPVVLAPNPTAAARLVYDGSPFPEAVRIGEYLQEHTGPTDKVAVLGSEPEIYFYSHRRSATGYIYMYGLMEPHKYALQMQREMIQEIEATRPKYVVFVNDAMSWLQRETSEKLIFGWFSKYRENFALVGLVNIVSANRTDYYFPPPENPESIHPSRYYCLIYERRF
jgi:Dolichyl-phosphate-mannose-protein mannosyltransferase